tara:strand:- start:905 stop:1615 length:711 start_codon:yes stop_codon:yes gene_type:complete
MPTYNVSVQNSNYNVVTPAQKKYAVGVTYDIPAKYLQNNNIVLDDFTSQFNNSQTVFNLTASNETYVPTDSSQIIVSVNGAVQHPGVDYSVTNNQIAFSTAPSVGDKVFIVALATTADLTRTINFVHSSGSMDMTAGTKGELQIDVTGQIDTWTVVGDVVGFLRLDIEKCSYNDYPNGFSSIVSTDYPTIIAGNLKGTNDNLTLWDKNLIAGDILRFKVQGVTIIRRFMVGLKVLL